MKQDQKYKHKLKLNINWCEIARKNDDILNLNPRTSIYLFIATQIGFNIFMLLLCSGDFNSYRPLHLFCRFSVH